MTRFARLLTTEPAAFEDTDDYLFVSPENESGADLDHLTLRRELAGAKNLLKAAEASKSEMLRVLSSLDRITDKRERHGENIHEAGAEANRHLLAIHHAFNKIAKGELGKTDVFANHLLSEMEKLAKVANEAAAKGLLHVKEHQFIN